MPLPKLNQPYYTHHLKGLNKKVKYRAFTVKEQKILLAAKESDDPKEQIESMCQIVDICTEGQIDALNTPVFDIEDLFLRIRIKSVSDVSEITYKDKKTEEIIKVEIKLDDVQVQMPEGHTNKIMISDQLGIMMKYPTLTMALDGDKTSIDADIIKKCIDYVFDADNVYHFADFTEQEVNEWIDSFDFGIMKQIDKFFKTIPKLRYETEIEVPSTKEKKTLVFEGLNDFFG